MQKYLVDVYRDLKGIINIKIFPVSEQIGYEDVTLLNNSLCYFFIHSNKSKKEIEWNFLSVRIGACTIIPCSDDNGINLDNNVYFIGKPIEVDGKKFCLNNMSLLIPLYNLPPSINAVFVDP